MSKEESVTWDQAKERSELFKKYWYHREAGNIMEKITGDSSLYFRNDKKFISIYAMFSAIRKELKNLREEHYQFYDLKNKVEDLEEKIPKSRTERIKFDLVNTEKSQKEIAEEYSVTEAHVSQVKSEVRQDL
jgi:DNA-directed RNA polymerase specialized sigma subunit